MQLRPRIFLIALFMLDISSCSVIDDALLTEEIEEFSRGVIALTAIIEDEFELAEELNTLGFTDNLQFQLELGGHPETNFKPLFKAKDIAARKSLLTALEGYAKTLTVLVSGQSVSSVYNNFSGAVENLKSLGSGNFNISHSLSFLDSGQLVNDLSLFDELLILPERDRRLFPIVQKGDKALRKAATLLYLDIGAPTDQSSKCSYTVPKNDLDTALSSLRLCKGGLRAIVSTAIDFDANIWNDKLAQTTKDGPANTQTRSNTIKRIVSIQKLGLKFDKLLGDTQAALIAMVTAHKIISDTLEATEKSRSASLPTALKGALFPEKLRELLKTAVETKAALLGLSDISAMANSVHTTAIAPPSNGGNSGNQQ